MTEEQLEAETSGASHLNRRTLLHGVGAVGTVGIVGVSPAAGRGNQGRGRGNQNNGNVMGQQENDNSLDSCDCPGGTILVKYNVENGEDCRFVNAEGPDVIDIIDWVNKDEEECQPIEVEFTVQEGYILAGEVCSFGGNDYHADEPSEDNGVYTYVSDLETRGGQQAAISNITFCVVEEYAGLQVDFIHGPTIPDDEYGRDCQGQEISRTYGDGGQALSAWWTGPDGQNPEPYKDFGGNNRNTVESGNDSYVDCGLTEDDFVDITFDWGDRTATATLDLRDSGCQPEEFALLVYMAPGTVWEFDYGCEQVLFDEDRNPTQEEGVWRYTANLPPLP